MTKPEWKESIYGERERHYEHEHGAYVLVDNGICPFTRKREYEMFAPEGRNFSNCHSYLEGTIRDAEEHIGWANEQCSESDPDDCCGCRHCACTNCTKYYSKEE
jgi:hypothetical protein